MKPVNLKKVIMSHGLAIGIIAIIVLMRLAGIEIGYTMCDNLYSFLCQFIIIIPCIFILIGLMDIWIPAKWIQEHVGNESGIRGALYMILMAVIQVGPLYGAFPVAHLFWKKGCSIRNVFLYLGAFSTIKAPMILFEAVFLGWRFTFIRAAVSIPVFILIAEIMTAYAHRNGGLLQDLEKNG